MERITISYAIETLDELLEALNTAYWDANQIMYKDVVFDLFTTVNSERNELSKLSIEDINMRYEPVTARFLSCFPKCKQVKNKIDEWFPRTPTADRLHIALTNANLLLTGDKF